MRIFSVKTFPVHCCRKKKLFCCDMMNARRMQKKKCWKSSLSIFDELLVARREREAAKHKRSRKVCLISKNESRKKKSFSFIPMAVQSEEKSIVNLNISSLFPLCFFFSLFCSMLLVFSRTVCMCLACFWVETFFSWKKKSSEVFSSVSPIPWKLTIKVTTTTHAGTRESGQKRRKSWRGDKVI